MHKDTIAVAVPRRANGEKCAGVGRSAITDPAQAWDRIKTIVHHLGNCPNDAIQAVSNVDIAFIASIVYNCGHSREQATHGHPDHPQR
jgi:hypothetical protein